MPESMLCLLKPADIITFFNIFFGVMAIISITQGQLALGAALIFFALIADGLDGIVARKTGPGELGQYMEAMGDMTSLAIAPIFLLCSLPHPTGILEITYAISLILYLFTSVIRLASFHNISYPDRFIGLPVSASAITLICLIVYLDAPSMITVTATLVLSLLMISPIPYPKNTMLINAIAVILILITVIGGYLLGDFFVPALILLAGILLYVVGGPFQFLILKEEPID